MNNDLKKYRVADLVDPKEVKVAFLLESPYRVEVQHGHPLAGSAGRSMISILKENVSCFRNWDPAVPLGCQILSRKEKRIAVMNVCNYPMDKSVYDSEDYRGNSESIEAWDLIRRNPGAKRRRQKRFERWEEEILEDLKKRLESLPEEALVVPCGNAARQFLDKCNSGWRNVYPKRVPHPSRNGWASARNFDDRQDFIDTLNRNLTAK